MSKNLDYDKFYKFWPQELKKFYSMKNSLDMGYHKWSIRCLWLYIKNTCCYKIFNETYDDERTKEHSIENMTP